MKNFGLYILLTFVVMSCTDNNQASPSSLFLKKDMTSSGITFNNSLKYNEELNPYTYRNFFNGGGVALGDINNDGLLDIYFTGNLVDNQLYLNKGNWQFENITESAGVACKNVWSSGVTFVDINYDGLLDIYVCKAGPPSDLSNRHNELFINNGDLTFSEQSKAYGLDINGLSVQANFFDYDKDGDLDCYLLNNSIKAVGNFDFVKDQRNKPTETGNKLLRNDDNIFIDVTNAANIYSSSIGFGLGITVSDYNNDTWPDIFVSNDFFERDYLYINNQDGTFQEDLTNQFGSISMGSMGADAADLNNDSFSDIMVTEMLPKTLDRQRTKTIFETWNKYDLANKKGYHQQFSRNALHRNMGNNSFFEISRFSNVAASEWSWATLLFDADNDGLKDIFVSNGIYRDLLDRDYLIYMATEDKIKEMLKTDKQIMNKLVDMMPSQPVSNSAFRNNGNFKFTEQSKQWGLDEPSFSNGSAYGDIDNDGDLDLVVNNVNMPAFIYENTTDTISSKSIAIQLKGVDKNSFAIGSRVEIFYDTNKYGSLENFPSRGFQSSISPKLQFGVGHNKMIDSLIIIWPKGNRTKHVNLKTNKTYVFDEAEELFQDDNVVSKSFAVGVLDVAKQPFKYKHKENNGVDFNKEQLLPEMFSNEGPKITRADVNMDSVLDYYIGGAKGQTGVLYLSQNNTSYKAVDEPFTFSAKSEDTDAVFFDSDNDGDLDLYVCSGGKSFSKFDFSLNDRLYINDGKGNFSLKLDALKFENPISTSTVSVSDFDQDGDNDIFIGERFKVNTYGLPSSGYILVNNGNNNFEVTQPEELQNIGLITDSKWVDLNDDTILDLVLVGEWMPISIFINTHGILVNKTEEFGLSNTSGLWKTLEIADLNNDGQLDIVAGNKGENTFFKPNMRLYVADFDNNGSVEQIYCYKKDDAYFPIVDRDELIAQIASLKQKLLFYKDYSNAGMRSIFSENQLKKAKTLDVKILKTSIFINKNGKFVTQKLPNEIQYSNVAAISVFDVNEDDFLDLILGGNQYKIKPQLGIDDASKGWIIFGDSSHNFMDVLSLGIEGQIRDFSISKVKNKKQLMTTINNDSLSLYNILNKKIK